MDIVKEEELLLIAALQELALRPMTEAEEGHAASLYDRWKSGANPSIDAACAELVLSIAPMVEAMESSSAPGARVEIPEALQAAVGRYFRAEKAQKKAESGSIIVRLGAGLELIASTLIGLEPVFVAVTPTRRSGGDTLKRLSMNETLQGGGLIEYSILRSTEDTVMVSLLFQDLKEPLTVRLSENGRPVSSQTVRDSSGRIHFDGLSAGEYRIDMSGSMDRSFTLRLLGAAE